MDDASRPDANCYNYAFSNASPHFRAVQAGAFQSSSRWKWRSSCANCSCTVIMTHTVWSAHVFHAWLHTLVCVRAGLDAISVHYKAEADLRICVNKNWARSSVHLSSRSKLDARHLRMDGHWRDEVSASQLSSGKSRVCSEVFFLNRHSCLWYTIFSQCEVYDSTIKASRRDCANTVLRKLRSVVWEATEAQYTSATRTKLPEICSFAKSGVKNFNC